MRTSISLKLHAIALVLLSFACESENKNKDDDSNGTTNGTGSGSDTAGSLAITGEFNATSLLAGTTPDQIIAYPLVDGAANSNYVGRVQTNDVDVDGSFSMIVTQDSADVTDYVLIAINSEKPAAEQFVNFIGLPTANDTNMLNLPISKDDNEVGLGDVKLDSSSPDAKSTTTATEAAEDLGISSDTAEQFADTGGVLRTLKNMIANCDRESGEGKCIDVQTTFNWDGDGDKSLNKFNSATDWSYDGYSFIVAMKNTSYDFDDVCVANNPYVITFFPPSDIKGVSNISGNITVTAAAGVSNVGLTNVKNSSSSKQCEPTAGTTSDAYLGYNTATHFNFIPFSGASFTEAIPSGDWKLTVAGPSSLSETYKFDLASASPINSSGIAKIWVPVLKVTADEKSKLISKVEVKFYTNKKGTWVETDDLSGFISAAGGEGEAGNSSGGGIWFLFDDSGQTTRVSDGFVMTRVAGTNTFATSSTGFAQQWRLPLGDGETRDSGVNYASYRISYTLRGTQINFSSN
jgi:hypothetical protein